MALTFKAMVAAAAFIAAGAANADTSPATWVFASGSTTLTLSQDALDAGGLFPAPENTSQQVTSDLINHVTMRFTSATTENDSVQTLSSQGARLSLVRVTEDENTHDFLEHTIHLRNFIFDLDAGTVSANVSGTDRQTRVTTDYGFSVLYKLLDLNSTTIAGLANAQTSGTLAINTTTANNFLAILGMPLTGEAADRMRSANWGTFTTSTAFINTALPEPATYATFLLGLGALLAAVRARRRAC
jgi:hypothetical protein